MRIEFVKLKCQKSIFGRRERQAFQDFIEGWRQVGTWKWLLQGDENECVGDGQTTHKRASDVW